MNIGDIASIFVRAAEIDRASREHVGPAPLRAQQLPYVHDWSDKAGWRKEAGDKLDAKADPLADERKAFWERIQATPSAAEIAAIDIVFTWLAGIDKEQDRRALLAWARSKAGGKSFRRWCFQVERIHPETGRRRKDRALAQIKARFGGETNLHDETRRVGVLACGHEISDLSGTIAEDAGAREGLNFWAANDAFAPFMSNEPDSAFSWAKRRNARRREQEARRKRAA